MFFHLGPMGNNAIITLRTPYSSWTEVGTDGILSTPDGLEECDVYPNTNYIACKGFKNDTVTAPAPWYNPPTLSRDTTSQYRTDTQNT